MAEKIIGVDFGSGGIKLAELDRSKDGVRVVRQSFMPLARGLVNSGTPDHDRLEEIASELKAHLSLEKYSARQAVMGLNGLDYIAVNRATVPWHTRNDLLKALEYDVVADPKILRGVAEGAILDAVVFGEHTAEDGVKTLDALLCGVSPLLVADQTEILKKAGLTVVGADLTALALLRATQLQPKPEGVVDVLVDIGADVLTVVMHENGKPFTVALMPNRAGSHATDLVRNELRDDDVANAETAKATDDPRHGVQVALGEARFAAASAIEEVLNEYAQRVGPGMVLGTLTLAGGGALLPRLGEEISARFGIAVGHAMFDTSVAGDNLVEYCRAGELAQTDVDLRSAVGLGLGVLA